MGIRILIVDDHAIFRDGLRLKICAQPGMEVTGEAANGRDALEAIESSRPDIVMLDILMPGCNGIEIAGRILAEHPKLKIIILSAMADAGSVNQAVKAGVSGYLLKSNAADEVIRAIHAVMEGNTFLSPEVAGVLMSSCRSMLGPKHTPAETTLSEREIEVLKLIADGLRTKEIAVRLNIASKTVDTYRLRLKTKLGCDSTAELIRHALRAGIASV